ncbi:hypothetical protein SERLA73DRAFT_181510 [Serpula lacrymans var. lacrymans S7.3]|uniref:TNFR-Cys domain-containing protein n=2 Tax=Serpula lacrymans var. lacrymans TaxID=341189 RepID=F8PY75_SERL3|nr:uncharacterized protein SERLADRAFT_467693 [Serpula lacrymans var. lacrymans S7.9]EGN98838.1 hypothetical protein SERLA73DRAFT_181510 [Serpula lacrymans var. lacrymans S7.3]EGO24427.1 hypothetical protein SERLADRAFT_467693 [Serpula lacrymans var. lacrymans S7.9]
MQLTILSVLASLALFTPSVLTQGGFSSTCDNYYVTGSVLYADCESVSGTYYATEVDLDYCLANNGGSLICSSGGSYSYTCSGCSLESGTYFGCSACSDCTDCGTSSTGIDLDQCVSNDGGSLSCT